MILNISFIDWLKGKKEEIIISLIVLISLFIIYFIEKFIASRVKKKTSNRGKALLYLIQNIIFLIIVFFGALIILNVWGFDTGMGVFVACVIAFVIGIGAKDLINDLFNGMSNIFANIYEIDEIIEINGFKGKVVNISVTKVTLQNTNGQLKTISCGNIKEVINYSRTYSSVSVEILVDYNENLDRVIDLLESNLPSLKEGYPQIIEGPIINGVEDVDASNIVLKVSVKTNPENHLPVQRAIKRAVINIFKEEKIKFGKRGNINHE